MKLRLFASLLVFLGSYFPLSLILLAQDIDYSVFTLDDDKSQLEAICNLTLKNPDFSLTILGICCFCFLASLVAINCILPKTPIRIKEATYVPAELMNYTLPYIVSFMSTDYQQTEKFVGLLIFLGWMFLIIHRSGQTFMNPLLIVFGWRHYEVTYNFAGGDQDYVGNALSKDRLAPNIFCKQRMYQDISIVRVDRDRELN